MTWSGLTQWTPVHMYIYIYKPPINTGPNLDFCGNVTSLPDGLIEEQEHVRLMNEEGEKLKSEFKKEDRKPFTWHMARSLMVVWHG